MKDKTIRAALLLRAKRNTGRLLAIVVCNLVAAVPVLHAGSFFVSASVVYGRGSGTFTDPWSLQQALDNPPSVRPGDTIWVRGGTYTTNIAFESRITGAPGRPVVIRNYQNERVTINVSGSNSDIALLIIGQYGWYWGLEITSDATYLAGWNDGIRMADNANHNRIINCIIHDALSVGLADQGCVGTVVYGNIMYYNGRKEVSNHGYNVYANYPAAPTTIVPKTYRDNISFNAYGGYQWHMYTQGGRVDSLFLSHNVTFSTLADNAQMLLHDDTLTGCRIDSNYWYGNSTSGWIYRENKPSLGSTLRGNYFMRGQTAWRDTVRRWRWVHENNMYYGLMPEVTLPVPGPFDTNLVRGRGNVWYIPPRAPSRNTVIVRKNEYEAERAHIIVYNWERLSAVTVDVASVLLPGASYTVRDVQNVFGPPVASGTLTGRTIVIPMTGTVISPPRNHYIGGGVPIHTDIQFGVFLITANRSLASVDPSSISPTSPRLGQNYPNPFNPSTKIPVSLPFGSQTLLVMYDLLGREVARLLDGYTPAGEYEIEWNASELPSGTYLCRLTSGQQTVTRVMTLVR